ncbi:fungal specific transcription factor domain-containing protein [Aspergillus fijiensis CBS 313.89]|uniref:Uncharacterized protein n=1 Tax=Aspergillus fijiensis CBS 313.89 TaxID=1448319 RepID=A0A8G1W3D1_9EURO|nr:uncharacterized protein BO72DRAFT_516678 [Aspergillus fijiensis CBS 313.89]RAK81603.1 hypothetical protein BO72DRAFT_516678 [Aspergillus fijiensis CBS 313.89]
MFARKGLPCEGYPPRYIILEVPSLQRHQRAENLGPGQHTISDASTPGSWPLTSTVEPSDTKLIHETLISTRNQSLLLYFETRVCSALATETGQTTNPYRAYILPLAHTDLGTLHAVLALASCHQHSSRAHRPTNKRDVTAMFEHQLAGMQSLGSLLIREELYGLNAEEVDILLATVLLLVLYDICESGICSHGVHLTGTAYICRKICQQPIATVSPRTAFLITILAWLDLLRGFSGAEELAEELAYDDGTHQHVRDFDHISLSETFGCPGELFYRISGVINSGQQYLAGTLSVSEFEHILEAAAQFFRTWDADSEKRAALGSEQKALAEAYRHTCIIRVLRFPDTWRIPCEDPMIAASVVGILDAAASIPTASPCFKRPLFPLFIAGAETSVPHQQRFRRVVHW